MKLKKQVNKLVKRLQISKRKEYIKKIQKYCFRISEKSWRRFFFLVMSVFFITLILITILNFYYFFKLSPDIKNFYETENLEHRQIALIFGAGINPDKSPSKMLKDRLEVGYTLLKKGIVSQLLVSGDNRIENYNEPQAMKDYLLQKGVPDNKIIEDFAGRKTYDSCYRTKYIFGQNKIYVITQDFHINRAVFLCKSLGLDTIGITADLQNYDGVLLNRIRDYFSMIQAIWDVKIAKPIPVLGPKINIVKI